MDNWTTEIQELQNFFKGLVLPKELVMNPWTNVSDLPLFVSSHLSTVIEKNGKPTFLPYLHRLQSLMHYFKENKHSYPEIEFNPLNNHL